MATSTKRTSWSRAVDLTDALAGAPPPAPSVGHWTEVVEGEKVRRALFYPNEVHSVGGEPESMKSWLLLHVSAQEIRQRDHVLYVDMEANDRSIVGRLRLLGVTRNSIKRYFHYFRPDAQITEADQRAFRMLVGRHNPTLVVLDGVTEAYAMNGLSINAAEDAATWFRSFSRQFQVKPSPEYDGPAIVELDHVVKSRDERNGWTLGTQHKKAGIKGSMLLVECVAPLGHGRHGRSRLFLGKDSPGGIAWQPFGRNRQRYVGDFHCDASGEGLVEAWIGSPEEAGAASEGLDLPLVATADFRALMQSVCTFIERNPGCSLRMARGGVKGTSEHIATAVEQLVAEGFLINEGNENRGRYVATKPFNSMRVVPGGR